MQRNKFYKIILWIGNNKIKEIIQKGNLSLACLSTSIIDLEVARNRLPMSIHVKYYVIIPSITNSTKKMKFFTFPRTSCTNLYGRAILLLLTLFSMDTSLIWHGIVNCPGSFFLSGISDFPFWSKQFMRWLWFPPSIYFIPFNFCDKHWLALFFVNPLIKNFPFLLLILNETLLSTFLTSWFWIMWHSSTVYAISNSAALFTFPGKEFIENTFDVLGCCFSVFVVEFCLISSVNLMNSLNVFYTSLCFAGA